MNAVAPLALAKLLVLSPLASGAHTKPSQVLQGTTINCVTVDKFAVKRCLGMRKTHLAECVNLNTGEINGAVLDPSGFVRCGVTGAAVVTETGDICAQVDVCGTQATACLNDAATLGLLRCLGLL